MRRSIFAALISSAVVVGAMASSASAATFTYSGTLQVGNNNGGAPGPNQVSGGTVTGSFDQGVGSSEVNFLLGLLSQVFGTTLATSDLGGLSGSGQLNSTPGNTANIGFTNTGFTLDNQGQPVFDACAAGTATCTFSNLNLTLNRAGGGSLQAQIRDGALTVGGGGGTTPPTPASVPEPGIVLGLLVGAGAIAGQRCNQQA